MKSKNLKTVAKINEVSITMMIKNGEKYVPIKPICEILGINESSQRQKINNDEILKSVAVLSTVTGRDGKEYKMTTIPYMYVFGWLFTINPKNVKEEAKESVSKYRIECYKALYDHFTSQSKFLQEKQTAMEKQQEKLDDIRKNFNDAKNALADGRKKLKDITHYSFEEWQADDMQGDLFKDADFEKEN